MSKRRKKKEVQTVWIDDPLSDPVQDIKDYAKLIKQQYIHDIVMPQNYYNNLYVKWLQVQNNMLL